MKNLKEMLIEKGYEEGNNCYYKKLEEKTFYFNMNDDDEFTTVTVESEGFGGQEVIIYDNADTDALEELENISFEEVNISEFVNSFSDGIEEELWNKDKTTLYVDCELAGYLDIDINCIPESEFKKVMVNIVATMIDRGYRAYISSSNEVTVEK